MITTNQKPKTLSIYVFDSVYVSEVLVRVNIFIEWITEQAIKHIVAFSEALKRVHIRLVSEGYLISNGTITPPADVPKINSNIIKIQQKHDKQASK